MTRPEETHDTSDRQARLAQRESYFGSYGVAHHHINGVGAVRQARHVAAQRASPRQRGQAAERFGYNQPQVEMRLYVGKFADGHEERCRERISEQVVAGKPTLVVAARNVVTSVKCGGRDSLPRRRGSGDDEGHAGVWRALTDQGANPVDARTGVRPTHIATEYRRPGVPDGVDLVLSEDGSCSTLRHRLRGPNLILDRAQPRVSMPSSPGCPHSCHALGK